MSKIKDKILIPWDFTKLSEYALDAAIKLSKKTGDKVVLLHIVDKEGDKNSASAKGKLEAVVSEVENKNGLKISYLIQEGTIFKTITEVAESQDANLIIMGTHGIRGMQKFTGSWALKVIEGSKVPFLVVQDLTTDNQELKIVFPLDFKTENREKLQWAKYFANHYNSKLFIFNKQYSDKSLKSKLRGNILSARTYLESNKIVYEIVNADEKGKFTEQTINFAKKIEADIILITTTKNINVTDYVLGAPEQAIIANSAKIPVMCVNPSNYGVSKFRPY